MAIALAAGNANALSAVSNPLDLQPIRLEALTELLDAPSANIEAARPSLTPEHQAVAATEEVQAEEVLDRWLTEETYSVEEVAMIQAQNIHCLYPGMEDQCVPYLVTYLRVDPSWLATQG